MTSEVTPHHFVLTDEALRSNGGYDTNTKMNPPLREEADRLAMIEGLRDGSIDVIATDHAPHHADEKALEFDRAPFGIVGLETAVPLCFDRLVHAGVIGLPRLVELLSTNPARVLGLPGGTIAEGRAGRPDDAGAGRDVTIHAQRAGIEVEEHPVRRLDAEGRGGGDDRRRPSGLHESGDCERLERCTGERTVAISSPDHADQSARTRRAHARRALRLRQRLSRPRVPESAPHFPAAVAHLALRAGSDRACCRSRS